MSVVSIIINNYNYVNFLAESISSALHQEHLDVEVIVVDDRSTDGSRGIIESFGSRLRPILCPENRGQGAAYNRGFEACRGDFIIFLDADDLLYPDAASAVVRAFADPEIVKVQWRLDVIDAQGRPTGQQIPRLEPRDGSLRSRVIQEGPYYDWHETPPGSGNAWRRRFLERVLPMPEPAYRHGADVYLITLAPVYGKLRTLDQPQGSYRMHSSNNYYGRALDTARLENYRARFETNCDVLEGALRDDGITVNVEKWKRRNFNYLWPDRLLGARRDIASVVPPGGSYILVNDDEWGGDEPIAHRRTLPFIEHQGTYWGAPSDDQHAIRELERMRGEGASHIVFWWTALWWLENYSGFARYLDQHYCRVLENERVIIFDVGGQ